MALTVAIGQRKSADWASIVLGLGLGLTAAIYLESVHASDWNSVYAITLSLSRIFAMLGAYFSLVGLVLVSRISWIEKSVGHDRLVLWHRKLGPYSLYFITAHVVLVVLSYAASDRVALGVEVWRLLIHYPWMIPAFLAFGFFIAAGITSYKRVRKNISYETWWTIHLYTYLAIGLGYMHQVLIGPMFLASHLAKDYWLGLYLVSFGTIILWRVAIPLFRSLVHNLRVEQIVHEGPGIYSIIMRGRNLNKLQAQGGQFFSWRFLSPGQWWMSHPYSLSAAPTNKYLRVTVKALGDHSSQIKYIKPGVRVLFEGPYGTFVAAKADQEHVLLVGGGVGITPLRALLEEMDSRKQIDVLYRASTPQEVILRAELDELARIKGARIHYLIGSRKEHPMNPRYLLNIVPSLRDSEVYVCGPTSMVEDLKVATQRLGVPKNRFHDEIFEFHAV
jgi:predicted ferric reductase